MQKTYFNITDRLPRASVAAQISPEFIRLPKPNTRCPYTGLSRSGLNNLILPSASNGFKAPVRSVCIRKRGAIRGTRLIEYNALVQHLHSLQHS